MKIVSGGQTGVDRAALDVAMELGLECGGWCPRGRRAEDGPLDPKYPLKETPNHEYEQRTEWNVRDSDGSLILTRGELFGGTEVAVETAKKYERPILVVDLKNPLPIQSVLKWLHKENIHALGIGGPREESEPGIYREAEHFLRLLFAAQ